MVAPPSPVKVEVPVRWKYTCWLVPVTTTTVSGSATASAAIGATITAATAAAETAAQRTGVDHGWVPFVEGAASTRPASAPYPGHPGRGTGRSASVRRLVCGEYDGKPAFPRPEDRLD